MARVPCAVCKREGDSNKMKYCDVDNLWVHYDCAGGGTFSSPHCPRCSKTLR